MGVRRYQPTSAGRRKNGGTDKSATIDKISLEQLCLGDD
jgi:hypothetical protein